MACESQPFSEANEISSVKTPIGVLLSYRQGFDFEETGQYDSSCAVLIHLRGVHGHTSSLASTYDPR